MHSFINYSLLTLLIISMSCSSSGNSWVDDSSSIDLHPPLTQVIDTDTILLGVNSSELYYAIPPFTSEQFKKNELFVVNSNKLLVAQIDSMGHLIRNITRKGDGPGELTGARSVKAWIGEDGDIYVLTHGNAFSLTVFDAQGNYKYVVWLFRSLEGHYHPKGSSYHMSKKEDGQFTLTLGLGSTQFFRYDETFFERTHTIGQYTIDDQTGKLISAESKLPYNEFDYIKTSLEKQTVSWGSNKVKFINSQNLWYITFPFSRKVYVYDQDFELKQKIELKTLQRYEDKAELRMGVEAKDTYERTFLDFSLYLGNLSIRDIQILEHLLIVQYEPPLPESTYLKFFPTASEIKATGDFTGFFHERDQHWLIHDLATGKEEIVKLPKGHHFGKFLDPQTLLVINRDPIRETFFLKYTLAKPIMNLTY